MLERREWKYSYDANDITDRWGADNDVKFHRPPQRRVMNGKKVKMLRRLLFEDDVNIQAEPYRRGTLTGQIYTQPNRGFYQALKKALKAGLVTIILCSFCVNSHADKLGIPNVNPIKLKENLAKHDIKLDLSLAEKTDDSWGILGFDSNGMCVNTYRAVKTDELKVIMKTVWQSMDTTKEK